MKRRHLLLSLLLVVAAYLALFGDKTPSAPPAQVVEAQVKPARSAAARAASPPTGRSAAAAAEKTATKLEVTALIPRETLIPKPIDDTVERDLFPPASWAPPPPKPEAAAKPPPPMAPPVPYTVLGKKLEGGQWEAYLGRGDEVFIVREGMTLEGIYRIKTVQPPTLTLLYLPLKQTQTLPIGGS